MDSIPLIAKISGKNLVTELTNSSTSITTEKSIKIN